MAPMIVTNSRNAYSFAFFLIGFCILSFNCIAQKIDTGKKWYDKLPGCPCKNPDRNGVVLGDGWAKDKANIKKYHKGAAASYRSYPPVKTQEGASCQQCCYDKNGDLITSGRGAGTPDKSSACKGEDNNGAMTIRFFGLIGHYWKDVKPWAKFMKADSTTGWAKYNSLWVPNNTNGCPVNTVSK